MSNQNSILKIIISCDFLSKSLNGFPAQLKQETKPHQPFMMWPWPVHLTLACLTPLISLIPQFSSVQSLSSVQLFTTPWTAARQCFLVHHQFPELAQTHVHRVGDTIHSSHPLSSPSPPAPNPSQHQGLFQWVSSSHEVAKVLEFQLQHQSFQWTLRTGLL